MKKYFSFAFIIFIVPNIVLAINTNITQINFTTLPQTININATSTILTTQTQDIGGVSQQVSETNHLNLNSTSSTGEFSSNNINWIPVTTLTMSTGTANRNFYYRDSTAGTYILTISAQGKTWTSATQTIIIVGPDIISPIDEEETSTPSTPSIPPTNNGNNNQPGGHRHGLGGGEVLGAFTSNLGGLSGDKLKNTQNEFIRLLTELIRLLELLRGRN